MSATNVKPSLDFGQNRLARLQALHMDTRPPTPEEIALAEELFDLGYDAQDCLKRGVIWFRDLDKNQQRAWHAIARHVIATRPHDRASLAAILARVKSREFFEDGLQADLGETGINTLALAYVRGHADAANEIAVELAEKGAVQL